jgi:DNA segregation ATPase FtsK/SpoIIIE, S-DNA-T family
VQLSKFALMAKKNSKKAAGTDDLQQEKAVKVDVGTVMKDERTWKIAGVLCLLVSLLLLIAMVSYYFTWKDDQDQIFANGWRVLMPQDLDIKNKLGALGAYSSHVLMYKGFGIGAFLFCTLFFMLGANLLFGKRFFNIRRHLRYVLLGLPLIAVVATYITKGSDFSWGGAVGNALSDWMNAFVGRVGTGIVLLVAALSYVIWRFNPTFRLPSKSSFQTMVENKAGSPGYVPIDNSLSAEAQSFVEGVEVPEELPAKNKLKNKSGVTVVMPPSVEETPADLELVVKENMPEVEEEEQLPIEELPTVAETLSIPKSSPKKNSPAANLELEIKPLHEDDEEPETTSSSNAKHKTIDTQYEPKLDLSDYKYPSLDLLEQHGSEKIVSDPQELEMNKNQIIATLKNYDITIQRISATVGPTVTLYEIVPAPGVRISRIKNLEDDIALSLAALGIRIIAPIPGKGTIGIEVPNAKKTVVSMKTLLSSDKFVQNHFSLPIAIGKKIDNENFIVDLAGMPHLLMAGATGQGKSVGLNAILVSLLYKKHPSQLKFVLVDPKKVELSLYRIIEKHFLAKLPGEDESIITDTKKVIHTLNALCIEMDNRYDLLKEAGCRNIKEYNEKFVARKLNPQKGHQFLPFIVLVIDEFADLIMTAGKEVEMPIARLAQLARAVGIHLIIATQRPSVNIITGTIKANFPARIAFKVSSKIDSRTILDAGGAEQLIGKGDMLISYNGELVRLQCAFVDTPEVESVAEFIGQQRGYPDAFLLPEYIDEKEMDGRELDLKDRDALFNDAARIIVQNQLGSTSLLQRRMKLGYNRAGRLMDQLEAAGVVGPNQGSKARDVQVKTEAELDMLLSSLG